MVINNTKKSFSNIIDAVLKHKVFGIIIFLIIIWLIFQATFGLGYYPMIWLEKLILLIESCISGHLTDSMFKSLLLDGIIKGVGGVVVFLPNIIILFTLLSFIEETNYMSRVVFIMDKIMKPFGLNGRSFISLFMGFGCNVPAIMSAQNIKNKNTRIITILINPLIPCSSRFTVYVLFISAFFANNPGTLLFAIYTLTVIIALLTSLILKKFFYKKTHELHNFNFPEYKIPSIKNVIKSMWFNAILFLKKISGAILIASIIIWFLSYFPHNNSKSNIEISYISKIGKIIEPVIEPLGFDWKMGVSILSGIAAKETIVGTLSELYQDEIHSNKEKNKFINKLHEQTYKSGKKTGKKIFTPLVALSFIVFISLYTPCVATLAAIRKTTGSLKLTMFVIIYTIAIAWLFSFITFQIGNIFWN